MRERDRQTETETERDTERQRHREGQRQTERQTGTGRGSYLTGDTSIFALHSTTRLQSSNELALRQCRHLSPEDISTMTVVKVLLKSIFNGTG